MERPSILLLNPKYPYYEIRLMKRPSRIWQPISLGYIASMLESDGNDLMLLDANALSLNSDQILEELRAYSPDIIILNSAQHDRWQNPIPTIGHLIELLSQFSEIGEKATLILLGPHGTAFPEHTFQKLLHIDFIVRGEPEITTLNLIRAITNKESFEKIKGICFVREGECIDNPDNDFLENLDDLPFPAYHLMPMEKYRFRGDERDSLNKKERFAIMITSRGCPYRCNYCNLTMVGKQYRVRSIRKVLEEIDCLVNNYGVNKIIFHDQVLTLRKERVKELCQGLIERKYALIWLCQGVTNKFPIELLGLMKESGCYQINFGLESGIEEISDKKRKNSVKDFVEIWEEGKKVGIDIVPNHMVGLPHETPELARKSNEFFKKFGFKYFFASATIPYPGTELYEIGRTEGTIKENTWESVVDAIGLVNNGFEKESIVEIMDELFVEEKKHTGDNVS